ncbi:MAG: BatD family protein [Pedobacter sp.]|uniref:BatD family protein n=1 Tax=Pedobacter sp. TaxID=1411316 RepID=UPI003393DE9A
MTKNFIKYILVLGVCMSCFFMKAAAQDTRAIAKLDQSAIRIGDQTRLHLTVYQQAKEQFNFPALADTLAGKLQVISTSAQDTIRDQNDPEKITVTKSFVVTGFDAGSYTIPSFIFTGRAGAIRTDELKLVVQSVKVDTTKAIFDIKQPLAVSYTFTDWLRDNWQLLLFPLLGLLLIAAAVYYWLKRKKTQPVKEVIVPALPAHEIALNQLTALKDKKLWQQQLVKEYYSELTDVLREYLEKRYAIKTHEKTTEEILAGLKYADINAESRNTLHQLLTLADLVKFAKEKPLAIENERSIEDAMLFVAGTRKLVTAATELPEKDKLSDSNTAGAELNNDRKTGGEGV